MSTKPDLQITKFCIAEEVWPPEAEKAFLEAMKFYGHVEQPIKCSDGKKYSRTKLISDYIKQRTGKERTPRQVSSHIQVYKQRQKSKSPKISTYEPYDLTKIVGPSCFNDLHLSNDLDGGVKIEPMQETYTINRSNFDNILALPLYDSCTRTVSSDKLALCLWINRMVDHETCHETVFYAMYNITPPVLPTISIKSISSLFDSTLPDLFQCVTSNAFFLIKCYVNLEINMQDENKCASNFYTEQVFYSPYKMNIDKMHARYLNGVQQFIKVHPIPREEVFYNNANHYIYRASSTWSNDFKLIVKELVALNKIGNMDALQQELGRLSYLTIISDKDTYEVLFVVGLIFEKSINSNPGYCVYKIVP